MNKLLFTEIISRIKSICDLKKEKDVAQLLDFANSTLSEHKKNNSIPFAKLFIFSEKKKLNFNWLLTGEGEMFTKDAGTGSQELIDKTMAIIKNMDKRSQENVLQCAEREQLLSDLMKERGK